MINTDIYEDVEQWHNLTGAMVTQVGYVFCIRMALPLKIDGEYYEVRVKGIGPDLVKTEMRKLSNVTQNDVPTEPGS